MSMDSDSDWHTEKSVNSLVNSKQWCDICQPRNSNGKFIASICERLNWMTEWYHCVLIFVNCRWLKDLFKLGLKKPLDTQDIYKNLIQHDSARMTKQFDELWEHEKYSKRPRIFNVIRKMYINKVIGLSILYSMLDILSRYFKNGCSLKCVHFINEQLFWFY